MSLSPVVLSSFGLFFQRFQRNTTPLRRRSIAPHLLMETVVSGVDIPNLNTKWPRLKSCVGTHLQLY